jgi:carbamoyl-phosphate synthase large subunit
MRSTGEVMGIDKAFPMAFAKSQIAASTILPSSGKIFISLADRDKVSGVKVGRRLAEMGFQLLSTAGTARHLREANVAVTQIHKVQEGRPNIIDFMKNEEVALIINTPSGRGARSDEARIRAEAVLRGVACITTMSAANAAVAAIDALKNGDLHVTPLQDWYAKD